MSTAEAARRYYAQLVAGLGAADDNRIAAAFAAVPRERYVGKGPWTVFAFASGYIATPTDDMAYLYQDVLVALAKDQGVNNGSPSLHARCLNALAVQEGESVLHIGAGTGYYTAILASLVGPTGLALAYEIDAALAEKAASNLADLPHVSVRNVSGTTASLPPSDAIYVNAGATHPLDTWLDALRPQGRLLFPLTPDKGFGGMLLVTRGADRDYAARFVCLAGFIPCDGAREPEAEKRLADALREQSLWTVKTLHHGTRPDESCWLAGDGWWLATR